MKYFLIALFLLLSSIANAAVTYDATSTGNVIDTASQLTDSITVGTGDNRLLICGVTMASSPRQVISGATFGATPMDFATIDYAENFTAEARTWLVFLKSPNSGTGTVTINFDDVVTRGLISCVSLAGVDQTSTFGTPATAYDDVGTTSSTVSVTLPTDGMAFDAAMTRNADTMSATGNNVKRIGVDAETAVEQVISTNTVDGTMSWSWGNSEWTNQIAVPINAAAASGGTAKTVRVIVVE